MTADAIHIAGPTADPCFFFLALNPSGQHDKASGEKLKTCTLIATEPNNFVAEVHDRMPALLTENDFEPWLIGGAGIGLLNPAAEGLLQRWPVSKRVNISKAPVDDSTLIDTVAI